MQTDNLVGQKFGQYELRKFLGAGNMGEVYLGYQPNLDRNVAVKVLPAHLAQHSKYTQRFIREAKIVASLEHAHIIPLHDYGVDLGRYYVVMRPLMGGTLAERIEHNELTLQEIMKITIDLCDALNYAHEKRIIHRDIKPSNIMFDEHGEAILVDFGIAKLLDSDTQLTNTGAAIGTPSYMAPEQWRGETITPAVDQYALAITVYNALTGHLPFEGETSDILEQQHLDEPPPPLEKWRSDLPKGITPVLWRALEKKPTKRYPNMTAFAKALEAAVGEEREVIAVGLGKQKRIIAVIIGVVILAAAISYFAFSRSESPNRIDGFTTTTISQQPVAPTIDSNPSLATTPTDDLGLVETLVVQETAYSDATNISATEIHIDGLTTTATLWTATPPPTATLPPTPLGGGTGQIAFQADSNGSNGIYVMSINGSNLTRLREAGSYARWSPDGSKVTFVSGEDTGAEIYVMDVDGSNLVRLTDNDKTDNQPAWSPDGTKIAFQSFQGNLEIYVMNADGSNPTRLTNIFGSDAYPSWSPDGSKIIFQSFQNSNLDIYVMSANGSDPTRLTTSPSADSCPAWSPDGTRIVFSSTRDGNSEIYVMNVDGTNPLRLTTEISEDVCPAWSPDGTRITFSSTRDDNSEIYMMNTDGSNLIRLTSSSANDQFPVWQPAQNMSMRILPTLPPLPTATVTAIITPSVTPHPIMVVVNCCNRVNVRSGPGGNYGIVDGADPSDQLAIDGKDSTGNWLRISRGHWIARSVVNIDEASAANLPIFSR